VGAAKSAGRMRGYGHPYGRAWTWPGATSWSWSAPGEADHPRPVAVPGRRRRAGNRRAYRAPAGRPGRPGGRPVRRLTPTGSGTAPIGGGRARSGPPRPPAARRSEGRLGPSLRLYPPADWAGSDPAHHWPIVQPHACRPLPGGYGPGPASYSSSVDCSPQVALVPSSSTSSIASEVMKRLRTAPCQWSWPGLEEHPVAEVDGSIRPSRSCARTMPFGDVDGLAVGVAGPRGPDPGGQVRPARLQARGA
jgi:hypothetical protein